MTNFSALARRIKQWLTAPRAAAPPLYAPLRLAARSSYLVPNSLRETYKYSLIESYLSTEIEKATRRYISEAVQAGIQLLNRKQAHRAFAAIGYALHLAEGNNSTRVIDTDPTRLYEARLAKLHDLATGLPYAHPQATTTNLAQLAYLRQHTLVVVAGCIAYFD